MKLCPECFAKCVNAAIGCGCGYSFQDELPESIQAGSPSPTGSIKFYVKPEENSLMGPYSIHDIKTKAASGVLKTNYLVQRDGEERWTTIGALLDSVGMAGVHVKSRINPTGGSRQWRLLAPCGEGATNRNLNILRNSALFAAATSIGCSFATGTPLIICFISFFFMFVIAYLLGFPWNKRGKQ